MSFDWRRSVNQAPSTERIRDVEAYVVEETSVRLSPIDSYYSASEALLRAGPPRYLKEHPQTTGLFVVGLISATENYFRQILARTIELCPLAQKCSASQTVSLGSVVWHKGLTRERGAFEHLSLASGENIRKTVKKFVGYDIKGASAANGLIEQFDSLCELRHNLVHSASILAGKNAIRLQVRARGTELRIQPGFAEFQESASVCTNLVAAFNAELFEVVAKRWAVDWRALPGWTPERAHELFRSIWNTFRSETDLARQQILEPQTLIKVRNAVSREFV